MGKVTDNSTITEELKNLERSREFHYMRTNAIQEVQGYFRDPERQIICEILANGYSIKAKELNGVPIEDKQAAEIERLRAVVAEYADHENWVCTHTGDYDLWFNDENGYTRAENALKEGE
jgi:hypothetical protein